MRKEKESKKRAVIEMDDRLQVFHQGTCAPGKCNGETACKNFPNNTYTCLCTHDSRPPTLDGDCPRKIVNELPGRIPNVQPPSVIRQISISNSFNTNSNINQSKEFPSTGESVSLKNHDGIPILPSVIIPAGIIMFGTFLFICIVLYIKLKARKRTETASPIILKRNFLTLERYAPNPQYSSCCSTDVPVIAKETLKLSSEIGEGCFGKVFKGEYVRSVEAIPEIVAVKVLKEAASKDAEDNFYREADIISSFQHPNILSFIGLVLKDGNINPMMVFEYMEHGDLAGVLRSQHFLPLIETVENNAAELPHLEMRDLLSIALQIASGMEYLAGQRFVHRDLACRNCLVANSLIVKIADFGLSRDVYTSDYYKIGGSRVLPVRWMSPESIVYGRYTLESDVWSYGVVLWEIFSYGKQPHFGHSNDEVIQIILEGTLLTPSQQTPKFIRRLMLNCWKTDPKRRITFPFIKKMLEEYYHNNIETRYEEGKFIVDEAEKDTEDEQQFNEPAIISYQNELKKYYMENINKQSDTRKTTENVAVRTLPRPPPLPTNLSKLDFLDAEGYLLPVDIEEPVHYLRTLPD